MQEIFNSWNLWLDQTQTSPNYLICKGSSGNGSPGSRFYSDLLDTLADFICIHQFCQTSFKAVGYSYNCRQLTYGSF